MRIMLESAKGRFGNSGTRQINDGEKEGMFISGIDIMSR
jgi:hypothetical protein